MAQRALHRYATITAVATFFLLIAGGLVTSTDSGLAVPDWPLSYGTWFPPMVGGIRYEHSHRMIAGVVGLMILILAVWTANVESRRWVRWLASSALAGVVLQALLGGLTVLLLLPPAVSIAHACLGQTVFCVVVSLAYATSPGWSSCIRAGETRERASVGRLSLIVAALAALQLVLGAVIRHTGLAVLPHILVASLLAFHAILLAWRIIRAHGETAQILRGHAWRLIALVGTQLVLGVLVFTHRADVLFRTAHVAVGALILAQAVILAWEGVRQTPDLAPAVGVPTLSVEIPG